MPFSCVKDRTNKNSKISLDKLDQDPRSLTPITFSERGGGGGEDFPPCRQSAGLVQLIECQIDISEGRYQIDISEGRKC